MGFEDIGKGIKTRLQTISKLRVYAPHELPDSVNEFPSALILPGETNYKVTFGGHHNYMFRIIILLAKQDAPSAFGKIMAYIEPSGTRSIRAAIDGDSTLDSSADDCRLISNKGIGLTAWGNINYLSTEFDLMVLA